MAHVGNGFMGARNQLGLKGINWRRSSEEDWTYCEDLKDLIEVRLPTSDRNLITRCVDESGESIPFTLLVDLVLDIRDGSAIKNIVGELFESYVTVLTHVVNRSIALRAGGLRSSIFFPFVPRSRASQTLAQSSPRLT